MALLLCISATVVGQDTDLSAGQLAQEIADKIKKVDAFSATVETGEDAGDGFTSGGTSSLLVSRDYGWKVLAKDGDAAYQLVTDYTSFYQYFPSEKRAMKSIPVKLEEKQMLRKPATDMNPLSLMEPASLRVEGTETWEGQTVYRVSGTTESQLMPGGPPVKRHLTALISREDGLPRKTVESVGFSTGTTVYRNVIVNPDVKAKDFQFSPPEGVTVIDTQSQQDSLNSSGEQRP